MRHLERKSVPTFASGIVLRDSAASLNGVKRNLGALSRLAPPLHLLALLCVCLFFTQTQRPVTAQDPPAPPAPTGLSASLSADGVVLSWTAAAGEVDGYEILRRRPGLGETELSTLVDDTGSSATSYSDTGATAPGVQYTYRVKTIRGDDRSDASDAVDIHFVSASCQIVTGDNHDILQCVLDAGESLTVSSAVWTPSFEERYAQTTSRPAATWVIADEYCGESTTVQVDAQIDDVAISTVATSITLACTPEPADELSVSCENVVENRQHKLSCALSGGEHTPDTAEWTPGFDAASAKTTTGQAATTASWVIDDEAYCGQSTTISVDASYESTDLPTVSTTVPLPCVIIVDDNCSLANAIHSANGIAQVEESDDPDGNDDCEAGGAPDDSPTPTYNGDDIILLTRNETLAAPLPNVTSPIHIEGGGRAISGDSSHRVLMVVGGRLSANDLTITNGLASTVGGGIYVNSGSLSLSDSTIKDSKASDIGGAIYAIDSDVDISDSQFTGNMTVKSHGGGLYFISSTGLNTLDITGATFKDNMATEDGGALKTAGGIATINKSTFVENIGDEGGAIESSETTLDITNSTFSGNRAREGGGLSSFSSFVTLTHTTWAYNSADEQGGGIAIIGWTGNFKIRNTLITNSASGGDCHSGPNPYIIIEFTGNFIQDGSCEPQAADSQAAASEDDGIQAQAQEVMVADAQQASDAEEQEVIVAEAQGSDDMVNARISDLTGDPPHHPLQMGSPAIDTANPIYCLLDDQPFTDRPQYGNCDIGAYEYPKPPDPPRQAPDPPPEPTATTPPPVAAPSPTPIPEVCVPNERIIVRSSNPHIDCEEIDILTLDKHPSLQGIRFALRLWDSSNQCLHAVRLGDNLYRLAIQYSTTVEVLRRHNDLANSELAIGQMLVLPFCSTDTAMFIPGAEVCFDTPGNIALIDTASPERTIHPIETYASEGMTCGMINMPGIVVLVAGAPS